MKPIYIVLISIFSVIVLILAGVVAINNTAIGYEETINDANSNIQAQQQRQHDLILQLVQTVEASSLYEGNVQTDIAKLRSAAESGDMTQASLQLRAVAENYPQLQAVGNYQQLMTEMAVSENLVTQYRTTYNSNVQDYKQFVRRFPASMVLNWTGYKVQDFQYLQFTETQLPSNLFGH